MINLDYSLHKKGSPMCKQLIYLFFIIFLHRRLHQGFLFVKSCSTFFFFFGKRETSIKTRHQAHLFAKPHKLRGEENTHYNKQKRVREAVALASSWAVKLASLLTQEKQQDMKFKARLFTSKQRASNFRKEFVELPKELLYSKDLVRSVAGWMRYYNPYSLPLPLYICKRDLVI